jgi:tRNA pseudouridine55 synthase
MAIVFHGLLVLDKPTGITSRDAVNRAQNWFPRGTRIGHTGTLDPLATGVLVLCMGNATRLTEYVQHMGKHYRATITLGATSDTDDADGVVTAIPNAPIPTREQIEQALAGFIGTIEQTPPAYSAAKVTGRRAYALARKGEDVKLTPRPVTIERIDIGEYFYPHLTIDVRCGKGTYIRSLARDLGQRLGCGGYITALRRLAVGTFTVADALSLDCSAMSARERLLPIGRAVDALPRFTLAESALEKLRQGQRVALPEGQGATGEAAVFDDAGRLRAITVVMDGALQPVKVIHQEGGDGSDPARLP